MRLSGLALILFTGFRLNCLCGFGVSALGGVSCTLGGSGGPAAEAGLELFLTGARREVRTGGNAVLSPFTGKNSSSDGRLRGGDFILVSTAIADGVAQIDVDPDSRSSSRFLSAAVTSLT